MIKRVKWLKYKAWGHTNGMRPETKLKLETRNTVQFIASTITLSSTSVEVLLSEIQNGGKGFYKGSDFSSSTLHSRSATWRRQRRIPLWPLKRHYDHFLYNILKNVLFCTCSWSCPDSSFRREASAPTCAQRWVSFFRYSISLLNKADEQWRVCEAQT